MPISHSAKGVDPDGGNVPIQIDRWPDTCPVCHRNIAPEPLSNGAASAIKKCATVVHVCTALECRAVFLSYYNFVGTNAGNQHVARLTGLAPLTAKIPDYHPLLCATSPSFIEIMKQCASSEALGLQQLTGMGFRKALEFLVKDHARSENPTVAEDIAKLPLQKVIATYIPDENVRQCAKRAAWLGNDETHYVRLWSDRDVSDLKRLIDLTAHWITSALLTRQFLAEMPEGQKP